MFTYRIKVRLGLWLVLLLTHLSFPNSWELGGWGNFTARGNLGYELWYFPRTGFPGQPTTVSSILGEGDFTWQSKGPWFLRVHPRMQGDIAGDDERSRPFVIEDLFADFRREKWEARAGYQTFSWKTVESYSPADFLNQTDREIDLLDPQKFGELAFRYRQLIQLEKEHVVEFFYFPYLTTITLPRNQNRYTFQNIDRLSNNPDQHVYQGDWGRWEPQAALRYSTIFGNMFDLSLFYYYGYDRFPGLIFLRTGTNNDIYIHEYRTVFKAGYTFQSVAGNWLWKGEGVVTGFAHDIQKPIPNIRSNSTVSADPYFAYNLGFEYTFYSILSTHDLGLILEFIGDTDMMKEFAELESFRPFRSHVFNGYRYSLNNASDGSLLVGAFLNYWTLADKEETELFLRAEAQVRIIDNLMLKFRYSDLVITDKTSVLYSFRKNTRFDLEALVSF